jgi:hypothetical protein
MSHFAFVIFSKTNQKLISLLVCSHLVWACSVVGFWALGGLFDTSTLPGAIFFALLQLYAAAQLILPALLFHPEARNRSFYLFWGIVLCTMVWLVNQLTFDQGWLPLLSIFKSALLLLVATLAGAALARYVKRLWEIVPVCIVITLADFVSWLTGPTAGFVKDIDLYYKTLEGPAPLVDMVLVKLAFPGPLGVAPVFGVSDWILVVFFAIVARRFNVNDNLVGASGEILARKGLIGFYLPIPVIALAVALFIAQTSGIFVPALPVIAIVMLFWYGVRHLMCRKP